MATEARVVLITGASAGIGHETALAFARNGCKVAATARRADRLDKLVEAAKAQLLPGEIQPYVADVRSAEDMQRVVDDVLARWGRLDVLVANAGIGQRGAVVESPWDDLDVVLRTNINGVLHSVRAAVPAMRRSGGGIIVMLSSVVSLAPGPYSAVYSAAKAAVNVLARTLRVELAPDHIWVTNILLGQTHSEFAQARLGRPGRVASRLPTMQPEFVARRIVQESARRRRTVTLRWLDRLITFSGQYLPWIMDRLMARFYRST
jgi:short-subunit dehydrogenase